MLIKSKAHGKTLYRTKPLLLSARQGYVRPPMGPDWFATTTTVWRVDELIKRRVRDWRRLLGEDGHTGTRSEKFRPDHHSAYTGTHSVFPAPLAEWILLRYGGGEGTHILDAFSGGPPRSVVSTIMGHQYTGFEIRQDQIDENFSLLDEMKLEGANFILGDGRFMERLDQQCDMGFTCPPYWNLEQYSNLDQDLSNLKTYEEFNAGMAFCAQSYFEALKPGAFCCLVVGPFRNKKTKELIDFPAHTVENFREAGFFFHQQIILSKNFASAAVRSSNAWRTKKLVPCHEFLQVFRKPE